MARLAPTRRARVRQPCAVAGLRAGVDPVERLWLHLRERFFSHRLFNSYDEIVTACCDAWNSLTAEHLQSLCGYPWITKVRS